MSKIIKFNQEARQKLQSGINKFADAVVCTLGPFGRNVLIEKQGELVQSTKDGVTVAKSIILEDPIENMGAETIKQAAIRSAIQAGDGTTTTTLLAQTFVNKGLKQLSNESNAIEIKKGINYAIKDVVKYLKNISEKITSEDQLKQIATISSNNDEITGALVATALEKVGRDGIVTVEESKTGETYLETVEGIQFERGYKSPFFVTNNSNMSSILDEPYILIYDGKILSAKELLPILENVSQKNSSLLIIAEDIEGEALATLIVNKARGMLKVCAVKAPDFGDRRTLIMEDISILTGGMLLSPNKGHKLDKLDVSNIDNILGKCRTVNINKDTTTIIDGNGNKQMIETRILELKNQIEKSTSNFEKEKLQERLAKMIGGVAIINVGGINEIETKEYKDRVEDALFATKAAIEEGILPGGGAALLHASKKAIKINKKDSLDLNKGKQIVLDTLSKPFTQILTNAGLENVEFIMFNVLKNKNPWSGYDLKTKKIVNMKNKGIIDPTKITRLALENAASVASIILTTEAVVFDKIEKEDKESNEDLY